MGKEKHPQNILNSNHTRGKCGNVVGRHSGISSMELPGLLWPLPVLELHYVGKVC